MPKAILEFDLPSESLEFYYANNGVKYYCWLVELDQFLRTAIKHGSLPAKEEKIYQEIRDRLHELNVHNLDL
jgi:hypothetical protein